MRVFLDSNILIRENFFRSSFSTLFLRATLFLGIGIVIPRIVMDEVEGNYPLRLIEKNKQFDKLRREINNLTEKDIDGLNLVHETKRHKRRMRKLEKTENVEILPYPKLSLRRIVKASYESRKPFKDNGEGYKDYVIWKSIVSYINSLDEDDELHFVTENVKDFCLKKDDAFVLHPDLHRQIEGNNDAIIVHTSLRRFFEEVVKQKLKGIEMSDLPELSLEQLQEIAMQQVEEPLLYRSAYGIEGLQFENDVTVAGVHNVRIDGWEVSELDDDEVLISFVGFAELEMDGYIEKYEYDLEEHAELFISDPDWNERVMAVSQTIETPIQIDIVYSKLAGRVAGRSVVLVDEIENY